MCVGKNSIYVSATVRAFIAFEVLNILKWLVNKKKHTTKVAVWYDWWLILYLKVDKKRINYSGGEMPNLSKKGPPKMLGFSWHHHHNHLPSMGYFCPLHILVAILKKKWKREEGEEGEEGR